jgi:hypothetical protein
MVDQGWENPKALLAALFEIVDKTGKDLFKA